MGGGEIRQDTKHVFDRKVETEFELFLISSETGQDLEMDIWIVYTIARISSATKRNLKRSL